MINFSKEAKESLEVIRKEIEQKECSKKNYNHLALLWEEITESCGAKRFLDISCQSCIATAIKSMYNHITYHEGGESAKAKPLINNTGDEVIWVDSNINTTLKSIQEIRKEYEAVTGVKPHHKKSAETMLNEIEERNGKQ